MNVNYLLDSDHIEINGAEIRVRDSFVQVETKTGISLFVSEKNKKCTIVSEDEFQLYFNENRLYMWTLSPDESFFKFKRKKFYLRRLGLADFLKVLFAQDIKWEFNQQLSFLDQVCVRLKDNGVDFIFGFDEQYPKGELGKIGFYNR